MDVDAFLERVKGLFAGDPYSGRLQDDRFYGIAEHVNGMTTAKELAVLNAAASLLSPDECYVEVGSFKGRSICGASDGVSERTFYVIENFVEFGMLGGDARRELMGNLALHCQDKDVRLLEGDAFAILRTPGMLDRRVGVYFYDGEHTRLSHFLALGVIEPLLADEALVLVDDASWPLVQEAHQLYIARHPGWDVVARWDSRHNDDVEWANGLHALRFRRPPGHSPKLSRDVRVALALQRGAVGPLRRAAWKTVHHAPWIAPIAKRIEPSSAHIIGERDHSDPGR